MTINYADGAESAVLAALRAADDVRAGSPELARLVTSWETAYHFSPGRLGLLAPLRLPAGLRVADLGCGSGVLTRALGETGASVLGIEGAPARAAAARERCRDLADVRIVSGSLTDGLAGTGPFDLALMCGVLEYSQQFAAGPRQVLRAVVDTLSEDGVLVVAIENQLGLKYLLGGAEDHHGKAWIGLADYPGSTPVPRTWTRRVLGELLTEAGLGAQRWLLPYPDYKMPRLVLDEAAFDVGPELVEKLVRDPLQGTFGGNDAAVSGMVAHRMAMTEGIGPLVAPSFLVVAGRSEAALAGAVEPGLAWLISGGRRPEWRRVRRLDTEQNLHTVHSGPGDAGSWLRQQHAAVEPLRAGRAMDAHLLDALRVGDLAEVSRLLELWRSTCTKHARALDPALPRHPYLPHRPGVDVLPADHLDIHPGNLIVGPDGAVARVDLEWLAGAGVDAELVMLRALLEFVQDLVHEHAWHPWPESTVHGVLTRLCTLVELDDALAARWSELVTAEAALQELVSGRPAGRIATEIENDALADPGAPLWDVPGGLGTLRADHHARLRAEHDLEDAACRERHLTDELNGHRARTADLAARLQLAEHQVVTARAELDVKDDRLGRAFNELATAVREAQAAWQTSENNARARAAAEAEAAALRDRLARTRSRLDALEGSKLVRIAHRSLWPAGRLVRGVRDLALARPGDEPDGLLRRISRLAPGVAARAGRYRRAAQDARDAGLRFDLPVPAEPVAVGAGQVVELTGWVAHVSIGVRTVAVRAGSRLVPANRGHHQPGVAQELRAGGVRAPEGSGITVCIPVAAADAPGELSLGLVVTLDDGTRLERDLPPVRLETAPRPAPLTVRWPADGPKVAVCLASYRPNIEFLARQLDSLRAQKHANWVCVICDDGSGPGTVAEIRALVGGDDRFHVVAGEQNVGFYRNFERALALAPGDADAVALCDQDDVWDADKLVTLLDRLADPAVSLAYADMRLIDEHGDLLAPSFWRHRRNQWQDLEALLLLNTITGAASLVRGAVVRELVLPFPPGTPSAFHDQWLAVAALAAGRVEFVDRPLHSYRQHTAAVTGRRDNRLDENLPGWLDLGLRGRGGERDAELEAAAEFELRRVAQFATVLLIRNWHRLGPVRDRLAELTRVMRDPKPLIALAVRAGRTGRPETAGAERYLLAAALRWKALRGRRLRVPPLPPHPID